MLWLCSLLQKIQYINFTFLSWWRYMFKFWSPSLLFFFFWDRTLWLCLFLSFSPTWRLSNETIWMVDLSCKMIEPFLCNFIFLLKLVIHKLHIVFQGPWSFGHQCPWSIPTLIQRKAVKFLVAIFFSLESEDNVGTLELLCH